MSCDTERFDTCRFRSPEKETHGEAWCCGSNVREMYVCYELNLKDLTPEHCKFCKRYDPKIIENPPEESSN